MEDGRKQGRNKGKCVTHFQKSNENDNDVGEWYLCERKVVERVIKYRLRLRDVNTYPLGEALAERGKEGGEHPDRRN
jgi:hypothetical protein